MKKFLEALDVKLKEIRNRAKLFGGFSIIFAGDFRQLESVRSTEFDLRDNCNINAIIILDNVQCFKEDPEYGETLKRMWNGDLPTDIVGRLVMYRTKVLMYRTMVLLACLTKVRR